MIEVQRFLVPVQPVQWRVPPINVGRKNGRAFPLVGKDRELATYQEALREALRELGAQVAEPPYTLRFWFWRRIEGPHDREADATNLQKAAEDALQGVVIGNDRDVRVVRSAIVSQDRHTVPAVGIEVKTLAPTAAWANPQWLDDARLLQLNNEAGESYEPTSNAWP